MPGRGGDGAQRESDHQSGHDSRQAAGRQSRPAGNRESRPAGNRESRIVALARPVLEDMGFDLVQAQISGEGRGGQTVLQIMIERADGGLTLDDCAAASRALSAALDVADPLAGAYVLEVGSPGVDRPLVRQRDFERWSGHEVRIELADGLAAPGRDEVVDEAQVAQIGRKRFRGRLLGVEEHGGQVRVRLASDGGEVLLPLDGIRRARLELTDALLQSGRRH